MSHDPVVIAGYARTPIGGLLGELSDVTAPELGAVAIAEAVKRAGADPNAIDGVLMGCVLPAGLGQAPARQALRKAGLSDATPAVTLNKMCGSGLCTVMQAHDSLAAGTLDVAVAGGMESMTNAPFVIKNMRRGHKYGATQIYDHMALDGLEDAYEPGRAMGTFAEDCAEKYQFTREAQDDYAIRSLSRANAAIDSGAFAGEIAPVTVKTRKGDVQVAVDEQPRSARPDKIPMLKPAFKKDGTVTAANASSISDGAAALVLTRQSIAQERGLHVQAIIRGHATHAQAPEWFSTAPIPSIEKALSRAGWTTEDVDLYEINEAFAVVAMAAIRDLDLDPEKVNVNGGACALGHPIGASGARILVTLLAALEKAGKTKGIASLCIGGGEAVAVAVERV